VPAESDYAVGFGEPDTAFFPPAPTVGIAAHNRPDAPGWSSAATAIHSVRKLDAPVLLFLEAAQQPPIVLDFTHNVFVWNRPLACLPTEPSFVGVYTQPVLEGDLPICPLPGPSLDTLLWTIGLNSFEGALAWWLPESERFHMARWPNLTELPHTSDQMRMIAMLGNAYLSPSELAQVSASSMASVQRLLNALSLMGILKSSAKYPEPTPKAAVASHTPGLFRRLRDRLASRG
jgi:hypothetical protein